MWTHSFQVPKLQWIQVLVCALFLLVLGQSTALFSLLCSCSKMASDRAKWSSYVHSFICRIIRYSRCEHNTMDFVPVPRHWFPGIKCRQPLSLVNLSLLQLERSNLGFWETTHLPLPCANINTYFSLRAKWWLRGGVGRQFLRNLKLIHLSFAMLILVYVY